MPDEKIALYDAEDGKVVCYLDKSSSGARDLYEEYNRGVDKIVDSFIECVPKLEAVKSCEDKRNKELQENDAKRNRAMDELDAQIQKCKSMLQSCDAEESRFKDESIRSSKEERKKVVQAAEERQAELKAEIETMRRELQNDIQKIESEHSHNAETVKQNLLKKKESCNKSIAQLEEQISDLDRQKEVVVTEEEIQKQLDSYSSNQANKDEEWRKCYGSKRLDGALEKEQRKRQEIEQVIQNRENVIEKRVFARLQAEGIGREVIVDAKTVIRDEKEIEYLAGNCARNAVMGIKENTLSVVKKVGMAIFCYPRLFLGLWPDDENDKKTILPVSIMIISIYFLRSLAPIYVLGWLLFAILYSLFLRKKGKFSAFENIAKAGVFKNILIALYPVWILLLEKQLYIFLLWVAVSFCLCGLPGALYTLKMCKSKNRKKYQDVLNSVKASYQERIQITDKALELYHTYYKSEEGLLQLDIEDKQREVQELSEFNQKEKEVIENWFETSGWKECIAQRKNDLLQEREQIIKKNHCLEDEIASKQADIKGKQDKISQIDANIVELETERKAVISKESQELQEVCQRKIDNCQEELNSIKGETENHINNLEVEFKNKIEKKTQEILQEKQKLQKEIDTINSTQKPQTYDKYEKEATKIKERYQKEYQMYKDSYRQHMDANLQKLKTNGFADVCGFNYVKAWSRLYPLISNTIGFPASLNTFCKEILVGLTAKATNANHEYCEIMPRNIPWGCVSASAGLPVEMQKEIADVLSGLPEFEKVQGWEAHDIAAYHVVPAPVNHLYKLRLTPIEDGPAIVAFDLGDLEKNIDVRDQLKDFILRSFVFDFYHCLGSDIHLEAHVVSMNHAVDFTTFNNPLEGGSLKLQVYESKSDIRTALRTMRENRESVRKKVKGADDLAQINLKLSRYNQLPEDVYKVLFVINTDYKELDDSDLMYLVELSRDKGIGMYTILFVDMNDIQQKEQAEKNRSIEMLKRLADAVGYDERFYTLERDANTGFCMKKSDKESFVGRLMQ